MFEYYVYAYGMEIVGLLLVAVAGCVGLALRNCLRSWVNAGADRLTMETKIDIAHAGVGCPMYVTHEKRRQNTQLHSVQNG